MTPEKEKTESLFERLILPALKRGGYSWTSQTGLSLSLDAPAYPVDVVVEEQSGAKYLLTFKSRQAAGPEEEEIPFDAMYLSAALDKAPGTYAGAYLVLGGPGWRLRDFFTGPEIWKHLQPRQGLHIVKLEDFVALAASGSL